MEKSKGIKAIVDAIESKRNLCNSEIKKIQESSIDELKKYFYKKIDDLTIDDITSLSTSDRNDIIKLLNLDINQFDFSIDSGFNELFQNIKDYNKLINDRCSAFKKTVDKCDMYEELLTSTKDHDLFTDIKDFHNFIDSLGLGDAEKLVAERVLVDYNAKTNVLDPEITQNISYIYGAVYEYPEIKDALLKAIKENKNVVDFNFRNEKIREVAHACLRSEYTVEYVLNAMVLGQELKRFREKKSVESLNKINRTLDQFGFDDMKILISEANRLIRYDINELSVRNVEYRDIQVTDSSSVEEFESKKHDKLLMIATLIKNQIEDYENSRNLELKEEYKNTLKSLIDEYNFTKNLLYQEKEEVKSL